VIELLLGSGLADTVSDGVVVLQSQEENLEDWQLMLGVAAMSFAVGMVSLKLATDRYRKSRLVKNTSTERIRSVALGRTELNGVARPDGETCDQPFTAGECVYGTWRVREWKEANPHDDEDDSKTWKTVSSGTVGDGLVLEDDTGAILLENPSTDLSDELETSETVGRGTIPDGRTAEFLESQNISVASDHRRRYEQGVIPAGTELYAFGEAVRDDEGAEQREQRLGDDYENLVAELVLGYDEDTGEFIVSDKTEDELAREQFLRTIPFILGGLLFVAVGAGFLGLSLQEYGLL